MLATGDALEVLPLSGGVASDIARVRLNDRSLCVKFALPKLKVQADWFAPVHRNAAEYAWLELVSQLAPENAVTLYGRSQALNGFVMEYLSGDDVYLWKSALLDEIPARHEAASAGNLLGRIHAASAQSQFDTRSFRNYDDFYALRVEPYLLHTAEQHKKIARPIQQIASQLMGSRQVLLHGDVSPKNILIRSSGIVLLDAECATMGDASFDPSFCLTHLVLKALHLPRMRSNHLAQAQALWQAYRELITWESPNETESRICRLVPVLMLARVDGKSPVEYLSSSEQDLVRQLAIHFIETPAEHVNELLQGIEQGSTENLA